MHNVHPKANLQEPLVNYRIKREMNVLSFRWRCRTRIEVHADEKGAQTAKA